MTAYALRPVGTVLRCPTTGDLYTRLTDGEDRDWLAVYLDSAAIAVRVPKIREQALDLLATSELPPGLVALAAPANTPPRAVAEVGLGDEMDLLVAALFAPAAEATP